MLLLHLVFLLQAPVQGPLQVVASSQKLLVGVVSVTLLKLRNHLTALLAVQVFSQVGVHLVQHPDLPYSLYLNNES